MLIIAFIHLIIDLLTRLLYFLILVYGKWRFYRSCAFLGEPGIGGDERYCLMRTGTHNIFTEYCTCNSRDGCNAASSDSYSVFNFILTPVLIMYKILL